MNVSIEYNTNDFDLAKTRAEKKEVIHEWIDIYNTLYNAKRHPNYQNLANKNSRQLVTTSFRVNIFQINDYEIIDHLINYLIECNLIVHDITVQQFKKFPTKPCLEHNVGTFVYDYRLKICCDVIISQEIRIDAILFYANRQEIRFYENASQRSRPDKLKFFEAVYVNASPFQFIGVMCHDESFINLKDVIETFKNRYNREIKEFEKELREQKTMLISLDFQDEVMRWNTYVDFLTTRSLRLTGSVFQRDIME
jgi:hypothetical protein